MVVLDWLSWFFCCVLPICVVILNIIITIIAVFDICTIRNMISKWLYLHHNLRVHVQQCSAVRGEDVVHRAKDWNNKSVEEEKNDWMDRGPTEEEEEKAAIYLDTGSITAN